MSKRSRESAEPKPKEWLSLSKKIEDPYDTLGTNPYVLHLFNDLGLMFNFLTVPGFSENGNYAYEMDKQAARLIRDKSLVGVVSSGCSLEQYSACVQEDMVRMVPMEIIMESRMKYDLPTNGNPLSSDDLILVKKDREKLKRQVFDHIQSKYKNTLKAEFIEAEGPSHARLLIKNGFVVIKLHPDAFSYQDEDGKKRRKPKQKKQNPINVEASDEDD